MKKRPKPNTMVGYYENDGTLSFVVLVGKPYSDRANEFSGIVIFSDETGSNPPVWEATDCWMWTLHNFRKIKKVLFCTSL